MSDNEFFPRLFSPLQVGRRTLRNRIALPATLTNYGAGHRVTERWIDFLAERAKGGAGMIITEIIAVDPAALAHGAIVTGYEAENEDGFKRAAAAVEGAGACLVGAALASGTPAAVEPGALAEGHLRPARRLQLDRAACHDAPTSCGRSPTNMSRSRSGSSAAASAASSCTARTATSSRRSSRPGRTGAPTAMAARSRTACASCEEVCDAIRADLRQRFRHRAEDAGRRRRRGRHRPGRGGAHHGGARAARHARLFRLQPGQLHHQPGKPRAGHAFPARAFSRHPQEAPPRRRPARR